MNRFASSLVFAIPCALALAMPARASFSNGLTGLASPDQTLTFEGVTLAHNEEVTTQFAGFGVAFEAAYGNPDPSSLYPNISGNRIGNFSSGAIQRGLFTIHFASDVSQAAFNMVTGPGTSTFQALLDGVLVDSATRATSTTNLDNWYAFRDVLFDEITISVESQDHALMIDNLQTATVPVTSVPEPESWALLLAGCAFAGLAKQRRQRRL